LISKPILEDDISLLQVSKKNTRSMHGNINRWKIVVRREKMSLIILQRNLPCGLTGQVDDVDMRSDLRFSEGLLCRIVWIGKDKSCAAKTIAEQFDLDTYREFGTCNMSGRTLH
jgi:hypothetical protein